MRRAEKERQDEEVRMEEDEREEGKGKREVNERT